MRHLTPFVAVYAVAAVLIVPGSLSASEGDGTPQQDASGRSTATDLQQPATAPAETGAPAQQAAPAQPAPVEAPQAPAATLAPSAPPPAAAQPPTDPPVAPAEAETAQDKEKPNVLAQAAAGVSVTIKDFDFAPGSVTVNVGDTVTWNNNGPTLHTATANDGSFDTGNLKRGESGSHTFTKAGTYRYICTPHPYMKGTVVVRAASSGQGGADDPVSSDDPNTGSSGSTGGSDDSGSAAGAAEGSAAGSSGAGGSSGSGGSLPATGADAAALAVLGGLLLVLGAATHRRSLSSSSGQAGRIGW